MIIAGVDEAGRGPTIGPMVLAVSTIEDSDAALKKMGVKDSKLLPPETRERLYMELQSRLKEAVSIQISAAEIDELRTRKSLNEIEAMKIGQLLNGLKEKPHLIYVDSPDPLQGFFGKRIRKYLDFETRIIAEHKSDLNYPIVGAASIIAKVERDNAIRALTAEYGEMGSGYSHDAATITFIKNWVAKNKSLPPFARKSWDTSQRLLNAEFQRKLFD